MRRAGWGSINLGPLTRGVLERFMVKLGKAFYYKHIGEVFDGVIYARHVNATAKNSTPEFFSHLLQLAPELASTERNGHSLMDQFVYRFNVSQELGAVYAVAQFSEQMIFQIMVVRQDTDDVLLARRTAAGQVLPDQAGTCARLACGSS
jgi:hypothetical protein